MPSPKATFNHAADNLAAGHDISSDLNFQVEGPVTNIGLVRFYASGEAELTARGSTRGGWRWAARMRLQQITPTWVNFAENRLLRSARSCGWRLAGLPVSSGRFFPQSITSAKR